MKLNRLRNLFKKRGKKKGKDEIPKSWEKGKKEPLRLKRGFTKVHIPMLKTVNRLIAFIMLAINFIICQVTLLSHPNTQPFFWFFLLNSYIMLRYLLVTRGE